MNLHNKVAKIDAEIKKTRKLKRFAEADGNSNLSYWIGYEEGLLFARSVFIEMIEKRKAKK